MWRSSPDAPPGRRRRPIPRAAAAAASLDLCDLSREYRPFAPLFLFRRCDLVLVRLLFTLGLPVYSFSAP